MPIDRRPPLQRGAPLSSYLSTAFSSEVVVTSLKVALVTGTILNLINQGTALFQLPFSAESLYQIALTYLVPYCVSTYSSVKAIRSRMDKKGQDSATGSTSALPASARVLPLEDEGKICGSVNSRIGVRRSDDARAQAFHSQTVGNRRLKGP